MTENPEVLPAHRFDERRLEEWLSANLAGFAGPMTVAEFKGGQSNPTYRLTTPGASYVLRRKPPGTLLPSAHAVDREYRIMHALADTGVPVPRTYLLCEDDSIVGTMFYVMDFLDGRILFDPRLPDASSTQERAAMFDARFRPRRWLCRPTDRALVQAIQSQRKRHHRGDGTLDGLVARPSAGA